MTLSGARELKFDDVSDIIAHVSILLKKATIENIKMRELEQQVTAEKIKNDRLFSPKPEDPLDDVIEILNDPHAKHKKSVFPYKPQQLQTADETDAAQQLIDNDFIDLQTKFDQVNDVATEQKKQKDISDTVENVIDEKNPFNSFDDFWWEDDLFNNRDSKETVEVSKNILDNIKDISYNILKNIRPTDNRTTEELVDDDFIEIDDRTQQELEDNDYIELESLLEKIDLTSAWDLKKQQ